MISIDRQPSAPHKSFENTAQRDVSSEVAAVPACDPAAPLTFIVNAASGKNDSDQTRLEIEAELNAAGRLAVFVAARADELPRIADEAASKAVAQRSAVIAVGGDGTINAVAHAAHARGAVMGVVPQGTFNYFARTHGLPGDAGEATRALLACSPQPVQVGMVNNHVFLVNASLGLYPELLEDREAYKARFGRSRWVALASSVMTLLRSHRQLKLHIERTAGTREVTTPTLFVGNNRLQLEQIGLPEAAAIEQGNMAAVMLRPIGTLAMLGLLFRGAMGSLGEADSVESFQFKRIVVKPRSTSSKRTVKVAFDGEVSRMLPPLEFRVSDKPLYLLKRAVEAGQVALDGEKA